MTYAGIRPTYINLHSDPPKREPVCATQEHSTPPPYTTPGGFTACVYATLTISHTQCVVVFSHNGIAEVLGLLEYVASTTKSRLTQVYNGRSLITSTTRQPCRLNHQRQNPCPVRSQFNINLIMVLPWPISRAEKSKVNMFDETIIRLLSKSKNY